jgi:DNA-binding NarL/FixJ family response regulator
MTVTPRVLVVDNDPRVGSDLEEMLHPEGYRVEVVRESRRKLLAAAKAMATELRPHVAIIDLRLRNEHDPADNSGLDLVRAMHSTYRVVHSAYLSPDITRRIAELERVTWISKGERPEKLVEAVRRATQQDGLQRKPVKLIDCAVDELVNGLFGPHTQVPPDAVHVVLHRLFPHAHKITLSPLAPDNRSSPAPSRRRSVVLKAHVNNLAPVAVKLAPAKQIRRERSHYESVSGHLGERYVARLENTAEFWDLGAACYTFFGTSLQMLPLFQDHYHTQQAPESLLKPLKHFFAEVWGALYRGTIRPCRSCKTLFERYDQVFHIERHIRKVDACAELLTVPGLPEPLINPLLWIVEHHAESQIDGARLAITHGDLHGQNLFVDGEHAWTIDFERTGSGHCLRDFIELETDIATRLAQFPQDDLLSYFRFAVALAALSEPRSPTCPDLVAGLEAHKALSVICGIRELAYQATSYHNAQEYLWGLLLNAVFVGTLVDEQAPQRRRAFLLASVLCERLSRWEQQWPPGEWSSICATP